ncbi:MAG: hypothetical protein ACYSUQ_10415 [Planctomycetota bacterium]|jgi:hypothetical protein
MSRELQYARTSGELGVSLRRGEPRELKLAARRGHVCWWDSNQIS